MSRRTPNFSVFNSRILVDTVGDVTDEALKASRMKEVIGVLGGRLFNWGQRKSLFPLHLGIKCCALEMAAAGASRFDAERFGVFFRSSPRQCDVLLVNGPISKKFAAIQSYDFGNKCQSPNGVSQWASVRFQVGHTFSLTTYSRELTQ